MRKLTLVFLLLASPVVAEEKESKLFRVAGWAVYGVSGGDVISTEIVLSNGGREVNPLMRNRAIRVSSHVLLPLSINSMTADLYRRGNKKGALWIRIALVAGYGYVISHNLRQVK
ncbi:MAG: hypothetical protein ACXABY_31325 [Candidatus Thorarchaeota archaeon]|jgi:hypothetical protein